jgi:phosphoribosylamine-glycine ligase
MGPTIDQARAQAYQAVAKLSWPGMHHRTDIAVGHTRAPSRPTQEVSG